MSGCYVWRRRGSIKGEAALTARDELHHEEDALARGQHLEQLHDVRVAEAAEDGDLAADLLREAAREERRLLEDLDRDRAAAPGVLAVADLGVRALADRAAEEVGADALGQVRGARRRRGRGRRARRRALCSGVRDLGASVRSHRGARDAGEPALSARWRVAHVEAERGFREHPTRRRAIQRLCASGPRSEGFVGRGRARQDLPRGDLRALVARRQKHFEFRRRACTPTR